MNIHEGVKGKTPPQFYDFEGMSIDQVMTFIRQNNIDKGWEDQHRSMDEWIALFHTEISEAYEEHRKGCTPTEIYYSVDTQGFDKPEGIAIEIADEVIRAMHFCAYYGLSLSKLVEMKMNYNKTRPYRHGGKVS